MPLLSPFVPQLEDNGLLTPLRASTIPAPVSAQTPAGETLPATPPAQTTAPTFRIPQTGDAARPALLLVLALCSAVLFVLLWRKKGKSNCIALKPGDFDRPGCFLYIKRTK